MSTVSCIGCPTYDPSLLEETLRRHFSLLGGLENLIPANARVVVKPNLVTGSHPDNAATTHPEFVRALVKILRERTDSVTLVECPGGPSSVAYLKTVYKMTGLADIGCEIVYSEEYRDLLYGDGVACRQFPVATALTEADVIISAAKLKTHSMTGFTGAVKNMFGSIPGLMKSEYHFRFPDKEQFGHMLLDLCCAVKPSLAFMDGIVGMEGNGPTGGNPVVTGITFASLNPYALDLVASDLIGMAAERCPTLYLSVQRELTPQLSDITLVGDDLASYRRMYKLPDSCAKDVEFGFLRHMPPFVKKSLAGALRPRPVIDKKLCIGCGKCAESCPQKIITVENRMAKIAIQNCIRCYCCQELCPKHAIHVRRTLISRI